MRSEHGHVLRMDDIRIGNTLRVIRIRKHLRQEDVARRARVSRQLVGRLEGGAAGGYPLDTTRAVAAALGVRLDVRPRWQGADLDRLVNAAHAELHESVASRARRARRLDVAAGGHLRALRRARRHRHPGLARRVAEPAHHRAQDRARGSPGAGGHDAPSRTPGVGHRPRAWLGPGHGERLGHRPSQSHGEASAAPARGSASTGVPSGRSDHAALAAGSRRADLRTLFLDRCHAGWP